MTVAFIGIGLIGGSMAISLKENGFATTTIGVDINPDNIDKAIRRRIIDEGLPMQDAIQRADVIVLATPVNVMIQLLPQILDQVDQQVVIDVGSTKKLLCEAVKNHPKRGRFVATHPMAGTEFSGPEAAIPNLFDHKCSVICDQQNSDADALKTVYRLLESLKMNIVELEVSEHDTHSAYVSHISHISSFALALTVLEKEKNEKRIFELASGGFSSTVRLAKSSAAMWTPIFEQNRDNVLDVLDEHINTLAQFRTLLIKKDFEKISSLIDEANAIARILK